MPCFDQKYSIIDYIMHIIEGAMHSTGTRWMCTIPQTLSRMVCIGGAVHETTLHRVNPISFPIGTYIVIMA